MTRADLDRRLAELAWSEEFLALGVSIDVQARAFAHASQAWSGMFEVDGDKLTGVSARVSRPIDLPFLVAHWGKPQETWSGDTAWPTTAAGFTPVYVVGTSGAFAWRAPTF